MSGQVFSNRVTDITNQGFIPALVDSVSNSNVIAARTLGGGRSRSWTGSVLKQPIQYAQQSTGGSFNGLDTFDTNASNVTDVMTWYPTAYYQSLVVGGLERGVNETEAQVISLVQTTMDQARSAMTDSLGSILYGLGSGKDFDGLRLMVDDGTDTSSYGGLTRSARPQINANVQAVAGGLLTLDYLASEVDNTSAASSIQESPTLIITTKSVFTAYEALSTPTISNNFQPAEMAISASTATGVAVPASSMKAHEAQNGFRALTWRGIPMVADDKCQSGVAYFLNERYLEFVSLKVPGLETISMKPQVTEGVNEEFAVKTAFQYKPMQTPTNQLAEVGQIITAGQFITRQPRRNGKLTGITGV